MNLYLNKIGRKKKKIWKAEEFSFPNLSLLLHFKKELPSKTLIEKNSVFEKEVFFGPPFIYW